MKFIYLFFCNAVKILWHLIFWLVRVSIWSVGVGYGESVPWDGRPPKKKCLEDLPSMQVSHNMSIELDASQNIAQYQKITELDKCRNSPYSSCENPGIY